MEDRISRLEDKIDKLTDAVITLATVEEKIRSINHRLGNQDASIVAVFKRQEQMAKEIHEIALKTVPQTEANSKLIWVGVTAAVSLLVTVFSNFL